MDSPNVMADRVLAGTKYLVLATADADGRPWATPVWFAREQRDFYWVSRPSTQHSMNIAERPDISLVVHDSQAPVGSASAFYARAVAGRVADGDVESGIAVFARENEAQGLDRFGIADVTGAAQLRLFRASVTEAWVLAEDDGPDRRLEVSWTTTT